MENTTQFDLLKKVTLDCLVKGTNKEDILQELLTQGNSADARNIADPFLGPEA